MDLLEMVQVIKEKKWIDLSHNVTENIPHFSAFNASNEKTVTTLEDDGYYAKEYTLVTQYGTHMDAPIHFAKGTRCLEEIELKEMILPLVVLHKEKEVEANHDYEVTKQDLLDFETAHGRIPKHSFVAFSSGWSKRWENHDAFYNLDEEGNSHTPGWTKEALEFLNVEREVTAIGHETLDTDSSATCRKNGGLLGELYWLSQNKYQIEVMVNLDKVPATGGVIVTTVPKIVGAPGFTVRSFAIVP